ncbi:helix-turn-helix domain-containing protein [Curvivirga sp.]|uniref:helix-turn-helix domain-containing protein n=1 Tax=Curvivirga sp. TaxID=2856848 RepID=UPI003B58F99F
MAGRALLGHRIRTIRKDLGKTQAALAGDAGVSAAYLNLIEHNRRTIGGALLLRLAEALEVPPADLTGSEEARLLADLEEIGGDPLFTKTNLDKQDITKTLGVAPTMASAMVALYRAYRSANEQIDALSERISYDPFLAHAAHDVVSRITSIRSFAEILHDHSDMSQEQREKFTESMAEESERLSSAASEMFSFLNSFEGARQTMLPADEVDDLLYDHGNYFDSLETLADKLRPKVETDPDHGVFLADIISYLKKKHNVELHRETPEKLDQKNSIWDEETRSLYISKAAPLTASRFEAAKMISRLDAHEEVEKLVASPRLTTDKARQRARESLHGYFAGALIFPYSSFLQTVTDLRHDIEMIQQLYAASWEQVCHRLTTLRRPGEEGVPFHFVRSDIAGNISKRFSASGLQIPRYGGICPRWAIHSAFLTPGNIKSQLVKAPDTSTYLFIARTVTKLGAAFKEPRSIYSILLGCDATYADRLVYADGLDRENADSITNVGLTCRQCHMENCNQRAHDFVET